MSPCIIVLRYLLKQICLCPSKQKAASIVQAGCINVCFEAAPEVRPKKASWIALPRKAAQNE